MADSSLFINGLQTVLIWSSKHIIEIIVFLSIFLEVSKVKISPISWLIKLFNKPITKQIEGLREEFKENIKELKEDISSQIDSLKEEQEKQKESVDELVYTTEMSEISRIRWEIIEFSNSIDNGQLHVRDEYRHIKDEYKKYEALIAKHNLENGITTEEIEKIKKHYDENKGTTSVYF